MGADENRAIPPISHPNLEASTSNIAPRESMHTDVLDNESAPVKLVVMDGIVMGPQHCAFDNCTGDLANSHGGVFCSVMTYSMD